MPRFKCPRCSTILEAENPATLTCPNCGFPGDTPVASTTNLQPATPTMTPPPPMAAYSIAAPGYAPSPPSAYPPSMQGYPTTQQQMMQPPKTSGKAIASMVLGIIGLIPYVGWLLCPVAIFLAVSARKQIRATPMLLGGSGFATAGLILGIVGLAFVLITLIMAAIVFVLVSDASPNA